MPASTTGAATIGASLHGDDDRALNAGPRKLEFEVTSATTIGMSHVLLAPLASILSDDIFAVAGVRLNVSSAGPAIVGDIRFVLHPLVGSKGDARVGRTCRATKPKKKEAKRSKGDSNSRSSVYETDALPLGHWTV